METKSAGLLPEHSDELGVTQVLARFAASHSAPPAVNIQPVAQALVDTVSVAVAATGQDGEPILRAWSRPDCCPGRSTVWATGRTTTASLAAMLNANAAHVLDYDDISPSMPMHPSAVLLPALIAVTESEDLDTARLVEAYNVGAAAFRALAEVLPHHDHYARGWHTTSTVGRLATVAALVRLRGLGEDVARNALGLASSLASGARSNFGSMTKALHAGAAARDAVMAVELALDGFTSNIREVEAEGGFLERLGDPALAPPGDPVDTLAERLEYWLVSWPTDWGLKRYPSCYGTHRALDAALSLRDHVDGASISSVDVQVQPHGMGPLRTTPATDHLQAKFSMEYTVALALTQGSVGLSDFKDWSRAYAPALDLASRVSVGEATKPAIGPEQYQTGFAVVSVELADGTTHSERVDVTKGDGRNPMSTEDLFVKFSDCCAAGGLPEAAAEPLFQALTALPSGGPMSDVQAALSRTTNEEITS